MSTANLSKGKLKLSMLDPDSEKQEEILGYTSVDVYEYPEDTASNAARNRINDFMTGVAGLTRNSLVGKYVNYDVELINDD